MRKIKDSTFVVCTYHKWNGMLMSVSKLKYARFFTQNLFSVPNTAFISLFIISILNLSPHWYIIYSFAIRTIPIHHLWTSFDVICEFVNEYIRLSINRFTFFFLNNLLFRLNKLILLWTSHPTFFLITSYISLNYYRLIL